MAIVIDQNTNERRTLRHPEKAHRPDTALLRKPDWIRVKAPGGREYQETKNIVRSFGLHTVCEEAGCPNIAECWTHRHATMLIMGCRRRSIRASRNELPKPRRVLL
jgi:lipoic acid synthetase